MGLPWFRLDANIATHDKILDLLEKPSGCKAFVLYVCGLGYAVGHATDGRVPRTALPLCHGNPRLAEVLIDGHLWEYDAVEPQRYYRIRNFERRQQLEQVTATKLAAQKLGGKKGACRRYHGPDCHCWKADE